MTAVRTRSPKHQTGHCDLPVGHCDFGMAAITLAVSTEIKPIDPVVFYDPNKPGRSCLVVGLGETTLAIPIIFSVIGVTALVAGIR
jgi:hypothetical protein